jgi:hypothetical protein
MQIDVRIANLDVPAYRSQEPEKVLQQQENVKRQKYKDICETHRESFHPFIASTEGMLHPWLTDTMLAPAATKILQQLAHITTKKTQKLYSAIVKHIRLCIAITLVKAPHHGLRASRKKPHQATSDNTLSSEYHTCEMVKQPRWPQQSIGIILQDQTVLGITYEAFRRFKRCWSSAENIRLNIFSAENIHLTLNYMLF